MAQAAPSAGAWLDGWLQRLAEQGWSLGPRERLQVQALLARLAASGELPQDPAAMLALAGPLLCGTPGQQRRYAKLLQEYVAEAAKGRRQKGAAADDLPEGEERPAETSPPWWRRPWGLAAALVLLLALALGIKLAIERGAAKTPTPRPATSAPSAAGSSGAGAGATRPAADTPSAQPSDWYVLPQPLPEPQWVAPAWSTPARATLAAAGAASLLLLAAVAWRSRQRRMALQGTRSDAAVEHHLLYDPAPVSLAPHPVLVRAVGRSLRQRVAGDTHALDLPGTLRATIEAHGALSPRWRALQRLPEYLVLIDRRHPADHQAAYAEALADALFRAGVALQVYHFDASPAAGVWARGALGNADPLTRRRVPLSELAARGQGVRLLVFGAADACINPATGVSQPWMSALTGFAERAWFTARPMADWGAAEQAADAAGFLVLPLQEAALQTLAGWLTAERLTLALDPDTPGPLPAELSGMGLGWVTGHDAPPPEVQERLLRELRRWLGGVRFQWLCACAIFPAVTPPLTMALGRHVVGEGRALALGVSALSALPWFRWGRMPDWLREALLDRLSPAYREQLQAVVQQRLSEAMGRGPGPALADVATRVNAWLQRGRGAAQDLVLADYLQREDRLSRLAQRLPEALRRRLFRAGRGERGFRPGWLAVPAAIALAGVLALTPAWLALVPQEASSPLPLMERFAAGTDLQRGAVRELRFIGELALQVRFDNGEQRSFALPQRADEKVEPWEKLDRGAALMDRYGRSGLTALADGSASVGIGPDGTVNLRWNSGAAVARLAAGPGQRALAAAFTPNGGRVVGVMSDGEIRIWGERRLEFVVLACSGGPLDQQTRNFADRMHHQVLATAPLRHGAEFIGLTEPVWRELTTARQLAEGETWIGNEVPAEDRRRLQVLDAPPARTVRDGGLQGYAVVSSACDASGPAQSPPEPTPGTGADEPIAGLSPKAQAALAAKLDRMFGNDKPDRIAATQEIARDPELFSDAITLAVPRALRIVQPSRLPMTDARASAVVNTLVLLQQATPATLNRLRDGITKLLEGAAGLGPETAKQAELVRSRLQAAAGKKPTIYVQLADESQRAAVQAMLATLPAGAFDIPRFELRPKEVPSRAELRMVDFSDRATARQFSAGRGLSLAGIRSKAKQAATDKDVYELWVDAGLCRTRQAAGCPAAAVATVPPQGQQGPASAAVGPTTASAAKAPDSSIDELGRKAVAQLDFVVDVFTCEAAGGKSAGKGQSESSAALADRLVKAFQGNAYKLRLQAQALKAAPTPPASLLLMSDPAHESTLVNFERILKLKGFDGIELRQTDIARLAPSEEARQMLSAGFKIPGAERRLLLVACSAN